MSEALTPLPFSSLARAAAASSTLRGLPPWRLLVAAAASPALVRSIIVSRSSCANAAMIVNMAIPIGPVVSSPSVREPETRSPFPDVLDNVQDVPGVAPQSVELPDCEHVSSFNPVQGLGELRTLYRGSTDASVGKCPDCAGSLECRELEIKVLLRRRNPRIPDYSHGRPAILLIPINFPL